jgi:VacB/RNase II family 3'-5' exoribonuclease
MSESHDIANHSLLGFAEHALREQEFDPTFGPEVTAEVAGLRQQAGGAAPRDLRALLWSSIDNSESRDLDQVEVAEALPQGDIRIMIGIADVDAYVTLGSAVDLHARANATSVYTGVRVYPMLPERLSTDLSSLNEGVDRLAVVVDTVIGRDGTERSRDAYRALVHNRAKLAYEDVGAFIEGGEAPAHTRDDPAMIEQLRLQSEASDRIEAQRDRSGALELDTIEATPVTKNGKVVDLAVVRKNRARELIENFMIVSNIGIAIFLESHGRSGIRRVVREPERWSRIVDIAATYGETLPATPESLALAQFLSRRRAADPERFPDLSLSIVKLLGPGEYALDRPGKDPGGHFGLAAHDYSHATAPNRRYADLVTQRLVKAVLSGAPAPYSDDELGVIAAHCTEREDAARKVERSTRKAAAALLLASRVGQGRVVRHAQRMDVGEYVQVRLLGTNPERGWIDFEGLSGG